MGQGAVHQDSCAACVCVEAFTRSGAHPRGGTAKKQLQPVPASGCGYMNLRSIRVQAKFKLWEQMR